MKNTKKILLMITLMFVFLMGTAFASERNYVLTKEYTYESLRASGAITSGFVEILIGNVNFVQYQDDNELIITPLPDEIRYDDLGNVYAYFDLSGLRPKQDFKITVKRECKVESYDELIPARTNSVVNDENKMYLEPSEYIESDDVELISKAKQITEEATTDYKKAEAIFEYVNVNMSYDESSAYANKGAASALKNMKGVCEEFTTLFVAMCRAVDIPSRAVEGYQIEDVESGDKIVEYKLLNHVWAEIYLDEFGWVPVEPTVIYKVNGERKPYLDSFCAMKDPNYVAVGIYNHEKPNRRMKAVKEKEFTEKIVVKEDILPDKQNTFDDINDYEWAKDAIQSLYAKGVVNGYSEEKYGPENNITRIEFICMLSRLLKYYDTQCIEKGLVYYYQDYDQNHYSKKDYDYLMRCYAIFEDVPDISSLGFNEITDVFGTGKFNMDKPITRAEVVAMMEPFIDDLDTSGCELTDINSSKFRNSILKAYASGLINGYPDGTFKPNNPITRAEMAVILGRYISGNIYIL